MVKERRVLFGVTDIKAVRLRCGSCCGDLLLPRTESGEAPGIPEVCPFCQMGWTPLESSGPPPEYRLVDAIYRVWRARQRARGSVSVVFEADDP